MIISAIVLTFKKITRRLTFGVFYDVKMEVTIGCFNTNKK